MRFIAAKRALHGHGPLHQWDCGVEIAAIVDRSGQILQRSRDRRIRLAIQRLLPLQGLAQILLGVRIAPLRGEQRAQSVARVRQFFLILPVAWVGRFDADRFAVRLLARRVVGLKRHQVPLMTQ